MKKDCSHCTKKDCENCVEENGKSFCCQNCCNEYKKKETEGKEKKEAGICKYC